MHILHQTARNQAQLRPFLPTLAFAMTLLFAGCVAAPKPGTTKMAPTPVGVIEKVAQPVNYLRRTNLNSEVPVFIVSSRNLNDKLIRGVDPFGNARNDEPVPHLAIADVQVGEGLSSEQIYRESTTEVKKKKTRLKLREVTITDPLTDVDPWATGNEGQRHSSHQWMQAIRKQLDQSRDRQITIFVHGFNTHLITNTEQAADLYHYMGRTGAMINFEWPSEGKLLGYIADKGNAQQSTRLFRSMIASLAEATDASRILILAHSAGNPIVVNAMRELRLIESDLTAKQLTDKYKIDRVVLAAPDMDVMEFFNGVFDRFYELANGVAVYASPDDKALRVSSFLFADTRLGRSIGQLKPWEEQVLDVADGIEMINVSQPERIYRIGTGHSYFHRDPWVSSDIGLFLYELDTEQRGLVKDEGDVFWKFPKDYRERLRSLGR